MREILFRGKQKEGRWVEGVYFKHDTVKVCFSSDDPKPRHLIIQDGFCDWGFEPPIHCVDVDPETVGQFTGMTDKNGKKIFEGDIVKDESGVVYPVVFALTGFCLKYAPPHSHGFHYDLLPLSNYWHAHGAIIEIIGNIHDNPELLEGE